MENKFDATLQRASLNWMQVGAIIAFVASIVWTLSGIYFRFEQVEANRETDRNRTEYVNDRIDKKFEQSFEHTNEKFDQLKALIDEKHKK